MRIEQTPAAPRLRSLSMKPERAPTSCPLWCILEPRRARSQRICPRSSFVLGDVEPRPARVHCRSSAERPLQPGIVPRGKFVECYNDVSR